MVRELYKPNHIKATTRLLSGLLGQSGVFVLWVVLHERPFRIVKMSSV